MTDRSTVVNRFTFFIALLASALGFVPLPAVAGCLKGSVVWERDLAFTTGVMGVVAGTSCGIILGYTLGPMYDSVIVRPPKHGRAYVEGRHRVVYMAAKNYTGHDRFVFMRRGLDMRNNKNARLVGVRVFVVPPRKPLTTDSRR